MKCHDSTINASEGENTSTVLLNCGFPIIIIGTYLQHNSSQTFNLSELNFNEIQRLKSLQGQIRSICLDFGASLIVIPSLSPNTQVISNTSSSHDNLLSLNSLNSQSMISKFKKYLLHRLYPNTMNDVLSELQIEDDINSGCLLIPSGFDTSDIIHASTGYKPISIDISEVCDES